MATTIVEEEQRKSIAKNTGIMTLATLGSRITGLLRTWAMAFALGNTLLTSAYQIAYNLPSMIYELAASGLLATAFLPLYLLKKEKVGIRGSQRFASNMLTITVVGLGLLALACSVFSPWVIETQTFTQSGGESKELAVFFFRVFAVQILFYGVGAVITGILNAERNFLASSLAPIVNNVVVTITMFGYVPISAWNPSFALWWLAVGTSLGVFFQFVVQIPALKRQGFKFRPHIDFHEPLLKEALKVAGPMFLYIAGTMITFSCRNAFSLDAAPNGPSTLNYAWMWYQLPYGVIAVSLSTTLLTELSHCAAKEDWPGFRSFVTTGLKSTFYLIIPMAALVGTMSVQLMQLFQAGAFNAEDAQFVGSVLAVWTMSLPFYAGYMYMYRVFGALRSYLQFAIVDFVLRMPQVALYWWLCNQPSIGLIGIPLADLLFYALMLVACLLIARRMTGPFGIGGVIVTFVKSAIAALVSGGVVHALVTWASQAVVVPSAFAIPFALTLVCIGGVIGLALSYAVCKLLRMPETTGLLAGASIVGRIKAKLLRR